MRRPLDPLLRLLLGAALCLPLCLGLWWWLAREPLINGLAKAVNLVGPWLWPETVLDVGLRDHRGLIVALLPPLTDSARPFVVLPLPLGRPTVILPLFWGLTLATPGRALLRRLLFGTLLLLPVVFAMILLYAQFQLALYRTHLPVLTETPPADFALALPDSPVPYYLWGLGRQLAVLVLPVVAPLLAWLLLHRSFLRAVIAGGLLQRMARSPRIPSPPPLDPER
ncbi:MAG: exosortase H-associated membrane protein [Candidatus Competibacter sp.]|nr:exosortase H-associated membrane protein [Candidatus Competibacter sp.]